MGNTLPQQKNHTQQENCRWGHQSRGRFWGKPVPSCCLYPSRSEDRFLSQFFGYEHPYYPSQLSYTPASLSKNIIQQISQITFLYSYPIISLKIIQNMYEATHKKNDQEQQTLNTQQNNSQPQPITFGSEAISMKCPFCLQRVKSEIIAKPELISVVFGIFMFSLLPNAIMIVVVLVVLQLTATRKHRCPLCERELGSDGKFLLIFQDEAYSFALGETGILLSKKILMTLSLFVVTFLILILRANYVAEIQWYPIKWNQYAEECPLSGGNFYCNFKNDGKSVLNWQGYVMRVDDNRQSLRRYYEHAITLYVKMQPSETKEDMPDLLLTGASSLVYQAGDVLDNLSHGDEIAFNATIKIMKSKSYVRQDRHLHLLGIKKTGNNNPNIPIFVREKIDSSTGKVQGSGLRMEIEGKQQTNDDIPPK